MNGWLKVAFYILVIWAMPSARATEVPKGSPVPFGTSVAAAVSVFEMAMASKNYDQKLSHYVTKHATLSKLIFQLMKHGAREEAHRFSKNLEQINSDLWTTFGRRPSTLSAVSVTVLDTATFRLTRLFSSANRTLFGFRAVDDAINEQSAALDLADARLRDLWRLVLPVLENQQRLLEAATEEQRKLAEAKAKEEEKLKRCIGQYYCAGDTEKQFSVHFAVLEVPDEFCGQTESLEFQRALHWAAYKDRTCPSSAPARIQEVIWAVPGKESFRYAKDFIATSELRTCKCELNIWSPKRGQWNHGVTYQETIVVDRAYPMNCSLGQRYGYEYKVRGDLGDPLASVQSMKCVVHPFENRPSGYSRYISDDFKGLTHRPETREERVARQERERLEKAAREEKELQEREAVGPCSVRYYCAHPSAIPTWHVATLSISNACCPISTLTNLSESPGAEKGVGGQSCQNIRDRALRSAVDRDGTCTASDFGPRIAVAERGALKESEIPKRVLDVKEIASYQICRCRFQIESEKYGRLTNQTHDWVAPRVEGCPTSGVIGEATYRQIERYYAQATGANATVVSGDLSCEARPLSSVHETLQLPTVGSVAPVH